MLMMTSQILKSLDFTKTQQFRYLENKAIKNNEKQNYNQGLFYCKKIVLQRREPLKIGPKSKKKKRKKKWLKK